MPPSTKTESQGLEQLQSRKLHCFIPAGGESALASDTSKAGTSPLAEATVLAGL